MSENQQDKTEQPTAKRQREAREEADSARRAGGDGVATGENNEAIPMPRILTTAPETGVDLRI